MRQNEVVTADTRAITVFDDTQRQALVDCLAQQTTIIGVLGKTLLQALDQGQASYDELIEFKWLHAQMVLGQEAALVLIERTRPVNPPALLDGPQAQTLATLTLDSPNLLTQPHPLAQD
jgi:hypothetical protein